MPDFISRRDLEAVAWSANFTQKVVSNYETFGFSQQDADQLAALQTQFADAVRMANAPSTRTTPTVQRMKAARKAFEIQARWMAKWIRVNPEISQATKIDLAIVIGPGREAPRRRIGPPQSAPCVLIRSVAGSRVSIALRNSDWPSRSGMAPDIKGAAVFAYVGEQPPAVAGAWGNVRRTSVTRFILDLGGTHAPGSKVWVAAQWVNARAEAGPVCEPVFTYLGYALEVPRRQLA